MTDIALGYDETALLFDVAVAGGDLSTDDGLATAVLVSLFTDRRATADDTLPAGETDRRGWWGDLVPAVEGDEIGSLLWLLQREKQTTETLERAREYAREALQWMLDDRVATSVEVTASYVRTGVMQIGVQLQRPGGEAVDFRYYYNWAALEAERVTYGV